VTQLAFTTVLLVGAGLLTRAVVHAASIDPGFPIDDVRVVSFVLPEGANASTTATLRAALTEPGATSLAFGRYRPVEPVSFLDEWRRPDHGPDDGRNIATRPVSSSYFSVLGLRLLAGRTLDDRTGSAEVVVSEAAGRLLWPDANPLGQHLLADDSPDTLFEVVAVVADAAIRIPGQFDPVIYRAATSPGMAIVRDPSGVAADRVRRLVEAAVPGVVVTEARLVDAFRESMADLVIAGRVAGGLGTLALVLAGVGAFGVFASMVEERRREIGVRIALGASGARVVRVMLGRAGRPVLIGLGLGLLLSMGVARLMRSMLHGLSPFDPIAYLQVAGVLVAAATIATWVPARRAARIDPAVTLKSE
jgi:hypothetical protein